MFKSIISILILAELHLLICTFLAFLLCSAGDGDPYTVLCIGFLKKGN